MGACSFSLPQFVPIKRQILLRMDSREQKIAPKEMNQFVYEDNSYAPVPRAFGLKIHCHEEEVFTEASPSRLLQDRDGPSIFK
jgi:hypothetical protein